MRIPRTLLRAGLAALTLVAASCGSIPGLSATPTRDPLLGVYIARGGGGALDAVLPLTKAFAAKHTGVTWQGLDDIGSGAGHEAPPGGANRPARRHRPAQAPPD